MAGIFDAIMQLSGHPDPAVQIAQAMGQTPGQPGNPAGANPLAPPPAPGGGPGQPAAAGAAPPQAPVQPQATQPAPDMMQLYAQFAQRQQSSEMFNRGLGLLAASTFPGRHPEMIMHAMTGMTQDPGAMFQNLMAIQQHQQGQQRYAALQKSLPQLAQQLGVPVESLQGMDPDAISRMLDQKFQSTLPPEIARNYAWAHKTYADAHPDATPEEIDQGAQGILLGAGGGGGDSATRSWRQAKILWDQNPATKGTPYPWGVSAEDNPTSFAAWQGGQKAEEQKQSADQQDALEKRTGYVQNLNGVRKNISNILGITGVDDTGHPVFDPDREALLKSVIGNPFAQSYVDGKPGVGREFTAWWTGLSDPQKQVLNDIKEATDPTQRLGGLGKQRPRRGESDVNDITAGMSGMRDVTKGYEHWAQGALSAIEAIDTATGNAYGASGEPDKAPGNVKDKIDPVYLYGGKLYPKGARPLPIPPDQLANARQQIQQASDDDRESLRQQLISHFRARNFDPAPLKG